MSLFKSYIELTKPRILQMVLVTTAIGYFLGGQGIQSVAVLIWTLLGAGLVCAGAAALNHYLERDVDALMVRTKNRPIPMGVIAPANALSFGIILVLLGVILLAAKVNLLTSFLSLLTAFLYTLVYTPLKRASWLNTTIGAIPGSIPPMGGWTAATNQIDGGAWALFMILFLWQHPHFYAIAWMFKDDYLKAGFKMLPCIDPDGKRTFKQIMITALLLIPVSLMPYFMNISGHIYFVGTFVLGIGLLWVSDIFRRSKSVKDARYLLQASVVYLPIVLFLIILDKTF